MLIEHRGVRPEVHPDAYVAPTAAVCGAVRIGPGARVLFGAVVSAEDGVVEIGANTVIMEQALVRGRAAHPALIGADVLVGPHAHLNGVRVDEGCFLATGVALFPGAVIGTGSEVRIHGVVHVNTVLAARRCRSGGLRSVIPRGYCRPNATRRSGPRRSRSTSPAQSTASRGERRQTC